MVSPGRSKGGFLPPKRGIQPDGRLLGDVTVNTVTREMLGGMIRRIREPGRSIAIIEGCRNPLRVICCPPHHPGMERRRFLLTSLAGVFAAPLAAEAQQAERVYRLGYLSLTPLQVTHGLRSTAGLDGLRKGLRDLGYLEGREIS